MFLHFLTSKLPLFFTSKSLSLYSFLKYAYIGSLQKAHEASSLSKTIVLT